VWLCVCVFVCLCVKRNRFLTSGFHWIFVLSLICSGNVHCCTTRSIMDWTLQIFISIWVFTWNYWIHCKKVRSQTLSFRLNEQFKSLS
jgi:hypothetical protein